MRRFLSSFLILVLMLGGGVLFLGFRLLETQPIIARMSPPTPEDVQATRAFYQQIRLATADSADAPDTVRLDIATLQGMLRMGGRVLPSARADAQLHEDRVVVRAALSLSLPLSSGAQTRWLNIEARVAPFEDGFTVEQVTLGKHAIPPKLARPFIHLAAELALGRGMGPRLLTIPRSMMIGEDELIFTLQLDHAGRSEMAKDMFSTLRGAQMPAPVQVETYYIALRDALDAGSLHPEDRFLPVLRRTLELARDQSSAAAADNEVTAALLALGKACVGRQFGMVFHAALGRPSEELGQWNRSCEDRHLLDREDLRMHFIMAAALKAASTHGFAVSLGEFKELHDAVRGSGFDFTDITANNSGIRLAQVFLNTPAADWSDLIGRIEQDTDIIPALDGIPERISQAAFLAQFGTVESPAYLAMLAEIEARIDALPLHQAGPKQGAEGG